MTWLRLALPLIYLAVAAGCGTEKSKDEQASEFYEEKLHTSDQKACNADGFLYDALDATCKNEPGAEIKLATWECTRDELGKHTTDSEHLAELDGFLADGFELHQCGENSSLIYLVIINKGRSDKEATLQIGHMVLGGTTTPQDGSTAPTPGAPAPAEGDGAAPAPAPTAEEEG